MFYLGDLELLKKVGSVSEETLQITPSVITGRFMLFHITEGSLLVN